MATGAAAPIDRADLLAKVQAMYRAVAETPGRDFHFETGRPLAERLGYEPEELDAVPAEAIESFAGVGYFFDLAGLRPGEAVLDLGSGSGMDAFVAALRVGGSGRVVGVDMTEEQLHKATRLRDQHAVRQASFRLGHIEQLDVEDEAFDAVISNGVINLAPDKDQVFREAARVLRRGGRLAMADIVTEVPLAEAIVSDVDLWASCIGGAPEQQAYQDAMARAGLQVEVMRTSPYEFLSEQARAASDRYGVKSVSVLAVKKA